MQLHVKTELRNGHYVNHFKAIQYLFHQQGCVWIFSSNRANASFLQAQFSSNMLIFLEQYCIPCTKGMLLHNSVMRTKTCISYKDVGPIGCPAFKESCFIPELQYTFETVMQLVQEAVFLQSMKYADPSTASCVLLKKCSLHFKYFKWSVFLKLYSIPSRRLYSRTIYNMLGNKNIHTAFLHSVP